MISGVDHMTKAFDKILAGLDEARQFARGEPVNGLKAHERSILKTEDAAVRQKAGLTQVQFADVLGASIGTVRKWESGERSPSGAAERLLRILAAEPKIVTRTLGIKALAQKRQPRIQPAAG
jgi:putative transcriptional regulator